MQDIGGATSEHKVETIKSREIESLSSTPKRRSKKKSEGTSAQADTQVHTADASPALNFKLILGVALVSVILGIVLGKRY